MLSVDMINTMTKGGLEGKGVYLAYTSGSQAITKRKQGRAYMGTEAESVEEDYRLTPSG